MRAPCNAIGTALFCALLVACSGESSTPAAASGSPINACSPLSDPQSTGYGGRTPDGHYFAIVDEKTPKQRAFYGTLDHMVEGKITAQEDSCAHDVEFIVEGFTYDARFVLSSITCTLPMVLSTSQGSTLPFTPVAFTSAPGDAGAPVVAPATIRFFCS